MPDPRTPVLVGAAAVEQRADDPRDAREGLALMAAAAEAAAIDAGAPGLLDRVDIVMAPRGFWSYADPGRAIVPGARTVVAEIGVLQTTLFGRAAAAIRDGAADVVLVVGAEARHRAQQARRAGIEVHDTDQGDVTPDEVWRPADDILERVEIERNLAMPVHQYAVMESAWRAARGLTVAEHLDDLARLWAVFREVAASNPHAWANEVANGAVDDATLAFPYTKQHVSQWNVDQAAALILCSEEVARSLALPSDRHIYPHAIVDSNEMVPLVRRRDIHRVPGFEVAGPRALELAGCGIDDVAHLELYSCFPIAVRVQQAALGTGDRAPTVSGGMAFAGGPLNSFVLQAMVRMVEVMRESPGRSVVTAVSGMLTKQGVGVWGSEPPAAGFTAAEVSAAVPGCEIDPDGAGDAVVVGSTVVHDRSGPVQGIAVCDLLHGARTVAATSDAETMAAMERDEWCGRSVRVEGGLLSAP